VHHAAAHPSMHHPPVHPRDGTGWGCKTKRDYTRESDSGCLNIANPPHTDADRIRRAGGRWGSSRPPGTYETNSGGRKTQWCALLRLARNCANSHPSVRTRRFCSPRRGVRVTGLRFINLVPFYRHHRPTIA
jgi:hypothetical protein